MDEMRMMSIGLVGAGFSYRGFKAGLDRRPHFIASDAGTSDLGPLQLGTGSFNYRGTKQDLGTLIEGARSIGAPFIMGSAGTAGGDIQVDAVADIVRDIARDKGLSFRLAVLRCEVDKSYVKAKLAEGKVAPMGPVPALTDEAVDRSAHVVAMMGVEPFTEALESGADVIVGGRCTDPAIFAAPPLRAGFHEGLAWHAARTMDKGPLMTTPVQEGSCAFITLRADHFVAEPTKAGVVSTPRTVAAVSLYENADPYETVLPSGTLDITNARFEAIDERSVRVSGAEFRPTDRYTVKLEGAAPVGYRSIQIIAARDPALIEHIDEFYEQVRAAAERNLEDRGHRARQLRRALPHLRPRRSDGPQRAAAPPPRPRGRHPHRRRRRRAVHCHRRRGPPRRRRRPRRVPRQAHHRGQRRPALPRRRNPRRRGLRVERMAHPRTPNLARHRHRGDHRPLAPMRPFHNPCQAPSIPVDAPLWAPFPPASPPLGETERGHAPRGASAPVGRPPASSPNGRRLR